MSQPLPPVEFSKALISHGSESCLLEQRKGPAFRRRPPDLLKEERKPSSLELTGKYRTAALIGLRESQFRENITLASSDFPTRVIFGQSDPSTKMKELIAKDSQIEEKLLKANKKLEELLRDLSLREQKLNLKEKNLSLREKEFLKREERETGKQEESQEKEGEKKETEKVESDDSEEVEKEPDLQHLCEEIRLCFQEHTQIFQQHQKLKEQLVSGMNQPNRSPRLVGSSRSSPSLWSVAPELAKTMRQNKEDQTLRKDASKSGEDVYTQSPPLLRPDTPPLGSDFHSNPFFLSPRHRKHRAETLFVLEPPISPPQANRSLRILPSGRDGKYLVGKKEKSSERKEEKEENSSNQIENKGGDVESISPQNKNDLPSQSDSGSTAAKGIETRTNSPHSLGSVSPTLAVSPPPRPPRPPRASAWTTTQPRVSFSPPVFRLSSSSRTSSCSSPVRHLSPSRDSSLVRQSPPPPLPPPHLTRSPTVTFQASPSLTSISSKALMSSVTSLSQFAKKKRLAFPTLTPPPSRPFMKDTPQSSLEEQQQSPFDHVKGDSHYPSPFFSTDPFVSFSPQSDFLSDSGQQLCLSSSEKVTPLISTPPLFPLTPSKSSPESSDWRTPPISPISSSSMIFRATLEKSLSFSSVQSSQCGKRREKKRTYTPKKKKKTISKWEPESGMLPSAQEQFLESYIAAKGLSEITPELAAFLQTELDTRFNVIIPKKVIFTWLTSRKKKNISGDVLLLFPCLVEKKIVTLQAEASVTPSHISFSMEVLNKLSKYEQLPLSAIEDVTKNGDKITFEIRRDDSDNTKSLNFRISSDNPDQIFHTFSEIRSKALWSHHLGVIGVSLDNDPLLYSLTWVGTFIRTEGGYLHGFTLRNVGRLITFMRSWPTPYNTAASFILLHCAKSGSDYTDLIVQSGVGCFMNFLIDFVMSGWITVHNRISPSDLTMDSIIGTGSTGIVWEGRWKNQVYAIKQISSGTSKLKEFCSEVVIMSLLSHPNVVTCVAACLESSSPLLVCPYFSRGSLDSIIDDRSIELETEQIISMALDISMGMAYLHSFNLIHRDLKPANLLVKEDWTVAVTDFGISRVVANRMTRSVGSSLYIAPEVFDTDSYTHKVDVYSFSYILWGLWNRDIPFREISMFDLVPKICEEGIRPPVSSDCPFKQVMVDCWDKSPNRRPSFQTLITDFSDLLVLRGKGDCVSRELLKPFLELASTIIATT